MSYFTNIAVQNVNKALIVYTYRLAVPHLTLSPVFQKLTHTQWVDQVQSELLLSVNLCCFWIAGMSVSLYLITNYYVTNSPSYSKTAYIDTQEKLRLNLHSLSVSEVLEYGRLSGNAPYFIVNLLSLSNARRFYTSRGECCHSINGLILLYIGFCA
jgi:hypothetical protein